MSEQHIRTVLREICEELDRCARKVVFPSLVGAGIALAGGCDNGRPAPADTSIAGDATAVYGVQPLDGVRPEQPPLPPYMAPPFDRGVRDQRQARESPPVPPYMGPDVGPPQPEYMAPDDAKPPKLDAGPQPLYNAPPVPPEPKP